MSEELQDKINEITARYKPELDRLQEEGQALGNQSLDPETAECVINVDFDLDWKDREIVSDLPP